VVAGFLADDIFNPLLETDGLLADSVGSLTGTGAGRGIAFMFIVSGLMISVISFFVRNNGNIRKLEDIEQQDNEFPSPL
jgi:hypothetical protein